mgnify:CR=1 FL=1
MIEEQRSFNFTTISYPQSDSEMLWKLYSFYEIESIEFGFTIATLSETDVTTTTTRKSTSFDDNKEEKNSTEMADFMSVSDFGFTISAPVSGDDSDVENRRPENQGQFNDIYQYTLMMALIAWYYCKKLVSLLYNWIFWLKISFEFSLRIEQK